MRSRYSMPGIDRIEHFVTLFDSTFLPMGLCLHDSLLRHAGMFHLWIVCMDEHAEDQLARLNLPNTSLIGLDEIESEDLLRVKAERSRGEYCWTLTPFTPAFVFARDPLIERVTYLDADLYFFDRPQQLLQEFEASAKHVLITDHAYDPEYDYSATSGRYCVQFMTFRNTPQAREVLRWWQDRCIEWCYDRIESGKFGDQKYLDDWPERFNDSVHVLAQVEKTLAPWNARYFENRDGSLSASFFHFHGFKIVSPRIALLFHNFRIGKYGLQLYDEYVRCMRTALKRLASIGIRPPTRSMPPALRGRRNVLNAWLKGDAVFRVI